MFNCSSDNSIKQPQNQQQEETYVLKSYGINSQECNLGYNSNRLLSSYHNSFNNASLVYNSDDRVIQLGRYTYIYKNQGFITVCYIRFLVSGSIKQVSREFEYN